LKSATSRVPHADVKLGILRELVPIGRVVLGPGVTLGACPQAERITGDDGHAAVTVTPSYYAPSYGYAASYYAPS
jgi:hypothetical protein